MSRMARWIYRDMLDVYYDKEEPLPLDFERLCDLLGVESDEERRTVERVLRLKFIKGEDGYRNEICDRVIAEYHTKAETARANGAKGGRPPKAKGSDSKPSDNPEKPSGFPSGSDQDASSNPAQTGSQANQEPITKNQRKPKPSSSSGDDGFDQFWEAYPRKQGKQDARKAWGKLKVDAELLAAILAAIEAQKEGHDWKHDDGQFIPHPTTWLNGGRWLDEVRPYVPQERRGADRWWETREAMIAKGLTLSPPLKPNPGEYPAEFRRRIDAALEAGANGAQVSPEPTPYIPPMPAAGESVLTDEQRAARRVELKELAASIRKVTTPLPPENKP